MYFTVTTFGCKVNQYESSGISEIMKQSGYIPAELTHSADIHIINSCAVTENSVRKVKGLISRIKRENPLTNVVLCGCFPKAFPVQAAETGADTIVPGIFKGLDTIKPPPSPYSLYSPQSERTRAFLKIQDGCNRCCAYCIIPKARGRVKSRSIDEIQKEASFLAGVGHKEIVITGINICAYQSSLVKAVKAVAQIDGVRRVRLSSLEPDMISEEDIISLAECPELCEHFHLSLQSGSDTVLTRMNRKYTAREFAVQAETIMKHFPSAALTTDIIAGFPGETEEEFAETLNFAKKIGFAKVHAFAFSPREGTAAAKMTGQLPKKLKAERVAQLQQLEGTMRADFFERLIGTEREVLMETPFFGHTRCYTPIRTTVAYERNSIVEMTVTDAERDYCTAISNSLNQCSS
ncbi:MAG: MiaB/RimO family radical SAM methylthiotransferase [Oscillospiraceae bacterium]|nr:MiaB/RimO family radical SAM methylthiotransferase [Oscillospiraceae bacterium]